MTLIDSDGVIQSKTQLPQTNKDGSLPQFSVLPYATTTAPYTVKGNMHILQGMCGMSSAGQTPGVTAVYDVFGDTLITGNPYPKVYGKANELIKKWSVFGYLHAPYTLSPDGGIVTSFAASDSLYVYYPDTGERVAYFAGYLKPTNIKPGNIKDRDSESIHFLTHYNYGGILYDNNENLYYRIIRLPKKDFDYDKLNEEVANKTCAIIILDSDFNVIGETILPEDTYYPMHSFANSDGLHIRTLSDDDDFLKFRVFKKKR